MLLSLVEKQQNRSSDIEDTLCARGQRAEERVAANRLLASHHLVNSSTRSPCECCASVRYHRDTIFSFSLEAHSACCGVPARLFSPRLLRRPSLVPRRRTSSRCKPFEIRFSIADFPSSRDFLLRSTNDGKLRNYVDFKIPLRLDNNARLIEGTRYAMRVH